MSVKEKIELIYAQKAAKKKKNHDIEVKKLMRHRPRILVVIIYNLLVLAFLVLVLMALSGIVLK